MKSEKSIRFTSFSKIMAAMAASADGGLEFDEEIVKIWLMKKGRIRARARRKMKMKGKKY